MKIFALRAFPLVVCLVSLALVRAQSPSAAHWVGTWAASQQLPEAMNQIPAEEFQNATLREIVHLSLGGATLRLHLSNAFGTQPLHLDGVHIARPLAAASSAIDPATDRTVTFAGNAEVTIPAGAEYWSDPLEFAVAPLSDLAVSIRYATPPSQTTGHPGARATSYFVHGDALAAASFAEPHSYERWFQLAAIDVQAAADAAAIVCFGDSITDGHGATTNGNDRWTDVLARRLQADAKTAHIGVLNQGIGGNHMLTDGLGQNALGRFDRDLLAQTGARWVILLEGVNDLGGFTFHKDPPAAEHALFVKQLIASWEQFIERAHAANLKVYGATILPYTDSGYYQPPASNEADRQALNQWIRTSGRFDAVIDFDRAMADPKRPDHLNPLYDGGDHLHPSPTGYKAMGDLIPLSLFAR